MGKLRIPISDHQHIRRVTVRPAVVAIGKAVAAAASSIAGTPDGYGVEESVGSDRVRVHVWAQTAAAERAEAKHSPLLQAGMQVKP